MNQNDDIKRFIERSDLLLTNYEIKEKKILNDLKTLIHPFRLSKNQALDGTKNSINYWNSFPGVTLELVETVETGIEWQNRSENAKGVLKACGHEGSKYQSHSFNIWRIKWKHVSTNPHRLLLTQHIPIHGTCTLGSVARLVSGSVRGTYLNNVSTNWEVCSSTYKTDSGLYYVNCHPVYESDTGEVLFALPAVITGKPDIWGFYPSINQNL